MDQFLAIRNVRDKLQRLIASISDPAASASLREIDADLGMFHNGGIDFKEVVDSLDDSVLITDADGMVLYVNPAYTRNTSITQDEVLNKIINDLIGPEKLFTGGAVTGVIEEKKRIFRLSTTYKTDPPLVGYVVGTPIFNTDGSLRQVVACSRPILTLKALQDDFETFVREVDALKPIQDINKQPDRIMTERVIGRHGSLESICSLIDHIAPTDATILITGESGVGKEAVADEIYRKSLRKDKPYIKINCASIPAHLMESELFGYEKGAFTGANSKGKLGLFEYANNGTLLLDEIGDMPMDLQVKLLRAIQSQEIMRIGGTKPIQLNIRFMALTNADLKKKIADGSFRRDLYYRLNVIPIRVPPLRERQQDIEELCSYFIRRFSEKYGRPFRLTRQQMSYLKQYAWPGNIRELENVIEYLVLCSSGLEQVGDEMLIRLLNISTESTRNNRTETLLNTDLAQRAQGALQSFDYEQNVDFDASVSAFEKKLLEQVLSTSSTLREAGEKLGLNASTICRKIKQYNIDYDKKKNTETKQ